MNDQGVYEVKIFDVRIDNYTKNQLRTKLDDCLVGNEVIKISKINPEFIHRSLKDKQFIDVLNSSHVNIVDGRGVLWAARYLTLPLISKRFLRGAESVWQMFYSGAQVVLRPKFIAYPITEAIPGVEAFNLLMQFASDNKVGVFLFGSSEKTLGLAIKNLAKDFPDLKISGSLNGYDFQKNPLIDPVALINKTDARVLIVALGSPKQENWINDNISKLDNIKIAVGEGGTLDRIADPKQKAPKFVNRIGLEWLWRLALNKSKTETRSNFKRFWNSVPVFMYHVVKWKAKNGQTKI